MNQSVLPRIYLSPPHMSGNEQFFVNQAFETNWIAPIGPNVTAFEDEFCQTTGAKYSLALSSGTAALHLALDHLGVCSSDEVMVSTLTFCASVNPIIYLGAEPVFIDSDYKSWNLDPNLLESTLAQRAATSRLPKALVLVHLYGQCADIETIQSICSRYGVMLIEDAAEALGATYQGRMAGTFGRAGIYSFNGNKILSTSGGGMLVSDDKELIDHARKLSTQARDAAPHYQHSEIGYNYRMSNVLAGIGRGQLQVLDARVAARRANTERYQAALGDLPGITFMPEAEWGRANRWLTVITIEPEKFGIDREYVRLALEAENIESRPVWKPMHLQPVYTEYESVGGSVAEELFRTGLCLPSGSNLTEEELDRVVDVITQCYKPKVSPLVLP